MDFVGAIKAGFKNYANFRSVASRPEYWYWYLFTVLAGIVLFAFDNFTNLNLLQPLFSLATLIPTLAVQVRRLRDAGHTWKWLLTGIGLSIVFIVSILGLAFRVIALTPNMDIFDNPDSTVVSTQIERYMQDPSFVGYILMFLVAFLLTMAYSIMMLVFQIQPSKSFEQGNKYLSAPTPENLG
jgi:uncharacterized membrane protein YhaH (DUF805 family)